MKIDVSQGVLDTVYFDCQKIDDEQFNSLLNEIVIPEDLKLEDDPYEEPLDLLGEHKLIHSFLESSRKYNMNPRSDMEEDINDLKNLDIDQIM